MLCNENEGAYLKFEGNCTTLSVSHTAIEKKRRKLKTWAIVDFEMRIAIMYLVTKPLIWSEAEGDPVVMETSI